MLRAVEEYFPASNIYDDLEVSGDAPGARDEESAAQNGGQTYPLQRVNTGVTSLVGSMNGQRPGGYMLVIDGLALTDVSCFAHFLSPIFPTADAGSAFDRLSRMMPTGVYFFVLRYCVKVYCVAVCPQNRRHWWSDSFETTLML